MLFSSYISSIYSHLKKMQITTLDSQKIEVEQGFECLIELTQQKCQSKNTIYFVGNGASSTMASHMAADALKNGKLRALALNDAAILTAVSNDINYDTVFAKQLEMLVNEGDMLIAISSSGNSPNIIKAIEIAKALKMTIITITGLKDDNQARKMGDLNFYVPAKTYGEVECAHQLVLHFWLDKYMEKVGLEI